MNFTNLIVILSIFFFFLSFLIKIKIYKSRYAVVGQLENKQRIRNEMDEKRILKVPGYSQIEINGTVHKFTMRDYSHPEINEVCAQVELMHKEYLLF